MTDFLHLRFAGARFDKGTLDVDALVEIVTFKNAIARLAAQMHLSETGAVRKRLRRDLRLALVGEIEEGSACARIARMGQLPLDNEDLFSRARDKLANVLLEADRDRQFTHEDVMVLALAKNIGSTLKDGERLFVSRSRSEEPAAKVTKRSSEAINRAFNSLRMPHSVQLVGKVFAIDTKNHTFSLDPIAGGGTIDGKYDQRTPALEEALTKALGQAVYLLVTGMLVSKLEGSNTRAELAAVTAKILPPVVPDFELKMAKLLRGPDINKQLAERSIPFIREMVWDRGLPAPVVFMSDDNGFSLEWSLPGPWEVSVDFDTEVVLGDTTNPSTRDSYSFELAWAESARFVDEVLVLFEKSGWERQ